MRILLLVSLSVPCGRNAEGKQRGGEGGQGRNETSLSSSSRSSLQSLGFHPLAFRILFVLVDYSSITRRLLFNLVFCRCFVCLVCFACPFYRLSSVCVVDCLTLLSLRC